MQKDSKELVDQLAANLTHSCTLFGELLAVPKQNVPSLVRNKALLRRLPLCFISLYELMSKKSDIPEDARRKPLDEIAQFFISKKVLPEEDKEVFLLLGSAYTAIRWAQPGNAPDEAKIVEHVDELYEFLKRMSLHPTGQVPVAKPQEATQ